MKHVIIILLLLFWNVDFSVAQDSIRVYGHVTDFNSQPIDSVSVLLKDKNFKNLYKVLTNKDGYFSFNVLKGNYCSLYAIKSSDYGKTKLEYWAWNIPAYQDMEINPQYERMEIYGVNAFEPQVGPWETYMVYFRPMSLTKALKFQGDMQKNELEKKSKANHDTVNVAPSAIQKEELQVKINEIQGEVVNITKVLEFARGIYMYGYLIQVKKPKEESHMNNQYDKITIILHSKETGEYGKGEYFYEKK